jgi:PDZ domain-containing protein
MTENELETERTRENDRKIRVRNRFSIIMLISVVLACAMVLMPTPYLIESPGPATNVLGKQDEKQIIEISKSYLEKKNKSSNSGNSDKDGQLLFTTVSVLGGPGSWTTMIMGIVGWYDPEVSVIPTAAVYGIDETAQDARDKEKGQMDSSQLSAIIAAEKQIGENIPVEQFEKDGSVPKDYKLPIDVKINVENVGGPSAGLMFSLGVTSKLLAEDFTNGKIIAGTGTMSYSGKVGPIGGINQKISGALDEGAEIFLVPSQNCSDITSVPQGIQLVKVSTLSQAIQGLTDLKNGKKLDSSFSCNIK